MASPRFVKHVSREELYTSLEARILYLHSFLDFSSRDVEALVDGAKYVKALIPAVVNIVYKKLLQYDITARAFATRSTALERPVGDDRAAAAAAAAPPDEDSPQIVRRKMFLRAYLARLCSDPSQMGFWEYLDKVGMMHVGLGRKHPLHIEYVHLGACLGFIQDVLTEAILSHPRLPLARKTALVRALGKVVWIQNDLMAKWHVEDGTELEMGGDGGRDARAGRGRRHRRGGEVRARADGRGGDGDDDDAACLFSAAGDGGSEDAACPFSGAGDGGPEDAACPFSGARDGDSNDAACPFSGARDGDSTDAACPFSGTRGDEPASSERDAAAETEAVPSRAAADLKVVGEAAGRG